MRRELAVIVMLAVACTILALMLWGWARRRRRDLGVTAPFDTRTETEVAAHGGETIGGLYVASTAHRAPLDRLAIAGLSFRAQTTITVSIAGVALNLAGERPVLLAAETLVGVERATWTVGRIVEPNGLVLIAWRTTSGTVVDSYLRLQDSDPRALIAQIEALVPKTNTLPASTPTESTE